MAPRTDPCMRQCWHWQTECRNSLKSEWNNDQKWSLVCVWRSQTVVEGCLDIGLARHWPLSPTRMTLSWSLSTDDRLSSHIPVMVSVGACLGFETDFSGLGRDLEISGLGLGRLGLVIKPGSCRLGVSNNSRPLELWAIQVANHIGLLWLRRSDLLV